MAFFDEIGKKLSQTGQMAVQKTKEMADVAKLNAAVSEEEKKINQTYFQIGQLYFSLHKQDYETDFSALIVSLQESLEKVENLKKQIQSVKGVVRCENCGAEIPNTAAFCSSCGAVVVPQEPTATGAELAQCAACGRLVPKEMNFCTFCGTPMRTQEPAPAPAETAESDATVELGTTVEPDVTAEPTTTAATQEQARVCTVCGTPLHNDAAFCSECGAPTNNA